MIPLWINELPLCRFNPSDASIQPCCCYCSNLVIPVVVSFILGITFDRLLRTWTVRFHWRRLQNQPKKESSLYTSDDYEWNIDYQITSDDRLQSRDNGPKQNATFAPIPLSHCESVVTTTDENNPMNENITDEWAILSGAIQLCCKRWEDDHSRLTPSKPYPNQSTKVVDFLTPKEAVSALFNHTSSDHHHKDETSRFDRSLTLRRRRKNVSFEADRTNHHIHVDRMLQMFKDIQRFSVNTSHPYFFNQMFGALDPIALAAELISLSVHTSVYTFETAPIFTLIEREVIQTLSTLVFENKDECYDEDKDCNSSLSLVCQQVYDGLMLPGGSISNLTALHLARYMSKSQHSMKTLSIVACHGDEKKEDLEYHSCSSINPSHRILDDQTELVAFVSQEAHYSFGKAVSITGLGLKNLICVPTLPHGPMDVVALDQQLHQTRQEGKIPFFVAVTAGSTVRGSFDPIEAIVGVCRKHEQLMQKEGKGMRKIWIHVDGAWGGAVIFSKRPELCQLLRGVDQVDSFTFNPHKMLGASQQTTAFVTRHKGIMKESNALGAKYLFDNRRVGAELDLGDNSFTCGRRSDAVKLWAMWKYYGSDGLGQMVESRVDFLSKFTSAIQDHEAFVLACEPWPFNVNFFYIPKRLRPLVKMHGIDISSRNPDIPKEISSQLGHVSVQLKLRLQQSGEMLIPYQPLSSQQGECFRLVIAGNKSLHEEDIEKIMSLMDRYGFDL